MERKLPSSIGDILAVFDRRKYWILVPFVVVVIVGIALGRMVPRTYQSTTTIAVTQPNIPSAYVRAATEADLTNRIQNITLEIISGNGFVNILNKLNLYTELRQQGKTNQIVGGMRRNTTVAQVPDTGDGRGGVGAFTISFVAKTPQEAQEVTRELANYFVNENLSRVHQSTQGTDAFLTGQVAAAAQQLATQQAKIQAFKNAHLGSLPEQAQVNVSLINQYQTELQSNGAALDQDSQQRVYLQSVLNVHPGSGQSAEAAPAPATPFQVALGQKQAQLDADLLKYTPEHPDIIRLKHEIAALKFQIAHAPRSTAAIAAMPQLPQLTGPSVNDQLRSQLLALNADIKSRQARRHVIEAELARLQGSVGALPAVQTEFASLDSAYQEMQKNYNLLMEKQHEAAMAVALDRHDPGGQLVVVQPASLPVAPYRPDPVLLKMGAVLIGLLVGLMFGLLVELRDDTMHSADEVAEYLKLPVMVGLPRFEAFPEKGGK
ncbi:MAG: hypothetical protein ABI164_03080 [Acidobacteriaceae bacterium]